MNRMENASLEQNTSIQQNTLLNKLVGKQVQLSFQLGIHVVKMFQISSRSAQALQCLMEFTTP